MILVTTNSIEGSPVKEYKGIITGESVIGVNFVKDIKANITDFFGGRSKSYEKVLIEAKHNALKELEENASRAGANAVIGITLDCETLGAGGSMLMVCASGTAVVI